MSLPTKLTNQIPMKDGKPTVLAHDAPIGTEVVVRRDSGDVLVTRTCSVPWLLGGHSWVVLLEGISGCYSVARVFPLNGDAR